MSNLREREKIPIALRTSTLCINHPTTTSHARMSLSTSTLSKTDPHLIFPHPSKHDRLQMLTADLEFSVFFAVSGVLR